MRTYNMHVYGDNSKKKKKKKQKKKKKKQKKKKNNNNKKKKHRTIRRYSLYQLLWVIRKILLLSISKWIYIAIKITRNCLFC